MNMKKKVTILLDKMPDDARYPIRRAQTIIQQLANNVDVSVIVPKQYASCFAASPAAVHHLENGVMTTLQHLRPAVLLCDQRLSKKEVVQRLRTFIPFIIHLDDMGEGRHEANIAFQTIANDTGEQIPMAQHEPDAHLFLVDQQLKEIAQQRQQPAQETMPLHLVVMFSDYDPSRLTFRTLRHLIQLQIPLRITIVVGEHYAHDVMDLKMMALQRNNTKVVQTNDYLKVAKDAHIILCSATYFPYEVAAIGIPCIVLAENDAEMNGSFPTEQNGFLHLGLGRKVKQSILLNAVMEFVLHEGLRRKVVERQLAHAFNGENVLLEIIYTNLQDSNPPKNNPLEIETPNML